MFRVFHKEKNTNNDTTPDGLTYDEFIEKYNDIPKIAGLCWFLGTYPKELKDELKKLMKE